MNTPEQLLSAHVAGAVKELFGSAIDPASVTFQKTNPQFEGDITLVVFPYVKMAGKSPEQTGQIIGEYLQKNVPEVASWNVVKGFLNVVINPEYWIETFVHLKQDETWGRKNIVMGAPFVMVEYSSPNTNKPLHLGHMRNILLGYSVAEIFKAAGNEVMKVNLVNDRGIHICKSMLAWQKWGNGETPESSGMKGDLLVGKYYVEFDKHYKAEIAELKSKGASDEEAEKKAPLILEAQEMLRKWEANDEAVRSLWQKMNGWVYDGFAKTYAKLDVDFDKMYYESNTYVLGKEIVEEGLKKNVFQKREDGAVIIDNTDAKLDVKVLLRSDGTSVYITQDLGTAVERHKEYPFDKLVYVVGNEQDYHFKTLKVSLKKLGYDWADGLYHLSYGMVELPEGKMKSREGTVVDADDLIDSMENDARAMAVEKGLIDNLNKEEQDHLAHIVGMAALKYFILKVDPKKTMVFNPKESIDLQGNTGPFIQYTHARIKSIWRKSGLNAVPDFDPPKEIHAKEKDLIKLLSVFPAIIQEAAREYSPAVVANYTYEVAKTFNQFYDVCDVLKEADANLKNFRIALCMTVARTIAEGMRLIGVEVPEKM
jgi:arginyl-tRNA synthetase